MCQIFNTGIFSNNATFLVLKIILGWVGMTQLNIIIFFILNLESCTLPYPSLFYLDGETDDHQRNPKNNNTEIIWLGNKLGRVHLPSIYLPKENTLYKQCYRSCFRLKMCFSMSLLWDDMMLMMMMFCIGIGGRGAGCIWVGWDAHWCQHWHTGTLVHWCQLDTGALWH